MKTRAMVVRSAVPSLYVFTMAIGLYGSIATFAQAQTTSAPAASQPAASRSSPIGLVTYESISDFRERGGLSLEDRRAMAARIGQRLADAYRNLPCLSMRADVLEPPARKCRVEVAMAPNQLSTRIFVDDVSSVQPALELSLFEGRFRELSRFGDAPRTVEYPADFENGTESVRLLEAGEPGREYWCMIGGYCVSWVGESGARTYGRLFRDRVARGEYLGSLPWERATAAVIVFEETSEGERWVQVFYVSPEDRLLGFDSFSSTDGGPPRLERLRRYSSIGTGCPEAHPAPATQAAKPAP